MKKKNILRIAVVTLLILIIPMVAMQISEGVDWDLRDFATMGVLIFGTGLALDWVVRKLDKKKRAIALIAILAGFILIWAELAVGLMGTPIAGS